jgi:hypothetical protein
VGTSLAVELSCASAVNALQFIELLAVYLGIRAEKVEVCTQWLPLTFLLHFLLGELVALAFVYMKDVDLHVLAPAWQVGKHSRPFGEVPDHVTAYIAAEDGAGERVLEQDLNHRF